MTKHYSQLDLLRFVYGETSAHESEDIVVLLNTDTQFRSVYKHLLSFKDDMTHIEHAPSSEVVDNILNYARVAQTHLV
jgi:hypothetical protein